MYRINALKHLGLPPQIHSLPLTGRTHRRGGSDEVTQIRLGMSSSPVFVNVNPSHQPFVGSPSNNIPHVNTFPGSLHSPNHENTVPQRSFSHTPPESERITNVGPRHQSWTPEMGILPLLPSNDRQPSNATANDLQQTTGLFCVKFLFVFFFYLPIPVCTVCGNHRYQSTENGTVPSWGHLTVDDFQNPFHIYL